MCRTLSVYLKNQYDLLCFHLFNSFSIESIILAKFRIAQDNYSNYRVACILSVLFIIRRNPKFDQIRSGFEVQNFLSILTLKKFSNFHGLNQITIVYFNVYFSMMTSIFLNVVQHGGYNSSRLA